MALTDASFVLVLVQLFVQAADACAQAERALEVVAGEQLTRRLHPISRVEQRALLLLARL